MDIRWFHGLAAYNKTTKGSKYCPIETVRRAATIVAGAELACSDKPIGAFGVMVDGDTRVIFERDCWSFVDGKTGKRCTEASHLDYWVPDGLESDEQSAHQWCAEQTHSYCEAFVKDCTITAVWCKRDASDARYWQARSLALKLRVPLVEVSRSTTIGKWCGTVENIFSEELA